ncbi:PAS domain S-box protein [Methanospirillum stamsii]|uniref:histidine kinase n=1 Tax=Methanospirillum stamsii TaxID=1277351 RepID=A0A2V2N946_9EURY|nr:PAS domain S-box protein [Methanospirillum stamsii]PWR75230.1 hypothetical protein DLD82_05415 [Methanospirillum stamsii]
MELLDEISKNFRKRFSTAVLVRIFFLFIILFGVFALLYAHNQTTELKENIQSMNNLSLHSLEKSIQLRFAAFKLYDDTLNIRLKDAFIPFFNTYELHKEDIKKLDLNLIKTEINENPENIDLYIINESNVIVATTNKQDLNLNFRENAPKFADYLDTIRNNNGFFPDQVTGELNGIELRKWAYMPTSDHKYVLEIGIKEQSFGIDRDIIMNLSDIVRDTTFSNPYIHDISIFNFKKDPVATSSEYVNPLQDSRINQIFETHASIIDYANGIPIRYLVYLKSERAIYGYEASFVAEVNTDVSLIENEILSIYLGMFNLFLIVIVISGILLYFTLIRLSRPVQDIIEDINQISQGDLNHTIRDPEIDEFNSLTNAIYRLKESILSEQLNNQILIERNILLNQIIKSIPEPILIINSSHNVIGWNNAMEDLTGFSSTDIIGSDREVYTHIFYPEGDCLLANLILEPGLKRRIPFFDDKNQKILHSEGWLTISGQIEEKYLSAVAGPVYDKNEDIIAVIETIRDFSILKATEEALITSKEEYQLIIENSYDIIFNIDLRGMFTFLSPSWERNTGFTILDTLGHSYSDYIHHDDIDEFHNIIQNVIKTIKRSDTIIFRIVHSNDMIHWYSSVFNPVYNSNNELIFITGVAHDITERKQVEDSLKFALHKLNVLNSITRHDIKNQLTVLMGFLHLDKEDLSDEEQIRRNEVERKVGITIYNQIEFARLYHEIGLKEPVWQNIAFIIKSVLDQINLNSVIFHNLIENLELFADPMFEKVIYTLFENTIRHGMHVTNITMQSIVNDEGLIIVYSDDGCGIMDEEKELIFNHGYGQNTGLGLFLSREILSLTGLSIHESGTYEKGVRFEIFIKNGLYRFIK